MKTHVLVLVMASVFSFGAFGEGSDGGAGVIIFPSVTMRQETGSVSGDRNVTNWDLRAGYRITSGLYFGIIYTSASAGGAYSVSSRALGNSIGYFYGMFGLIGSYYLTATSNESTATGSLTRSNGSGFQLDLTCLIPLTSGISLAPVLTYRNIAYSTVQDVNGVISSEGQSHSLFTPFLGVFFIF